MIRTALQWAMKHRYIRENVADFADKPKHVRYHGFEPYSIQEVANLLQLTANEPIAVPIFLASFYGLRRSELLGLRWSANRSTRKTRRRNKNRNTRRYHRIKVISSYQK